MTHIYIKLHERMLPSEEWTLEFKYLLMGMRKSIDEMFLLSQVRRGNSVSVCERRKSSTVPKMIQSVTENPII